MNDSVNNLDSLLAEARARIQSAEDSRALVAGYVGPALEKVVSAFLGESRREAA